MKKVYKYKKGAKSTIDSVEVVEGESIEQKIERIVENKEPITDGAPEIFTERKDGIIAAYNIRTDRWEIAAEAMDKVAASIAAKRENLPVMDENNNEEGTNTGTNDNAGGESAQGNNE